MFGVLEKILAFVILFPPVYLLFRYLRWYARQDQDHSQDHSKDQD
jgi:hypothetical protein